MSDTESTESEDGPRSIFLTPLPQELHSTYTDAPFEKCVECGRVFENELVHYAIQKVIRDGETVFEFALCLPCMEKMNGEISEESSRNIESFLETHELMENGLGACALCGHGFDENPAEAILFGVALAGFLVGSARAMCSDCSEQFDSLLSEATRGGMEDFTVRNFPGVPADVDVPAGFLGI